MMEEKHASGSDEKHKVDGESLFLRLEFHVSC